MRMERASKAGSPWSGWLLSLILVAFAGVFASLRASSTEAEPEKAALPPEITPAIERAILKACQWLAKNQTKEGGLRASTTVAATSLAGLAWLASGSTPHEGAYATPLSQALRFLLRSQGKLGFISEAGESGPSMMYGHGYATQFLAQACGMLRDPELGTKVTEALQRATRLIEGSQNAFGGWNTMPNASATDDGSGAVAIMQITALRAAESCGVHVRQQVIERAKKYLLEMTSEGGWYAYNWHARGQGNSPATTGAGMYMLGALNLQDHPKYKKGIRNLLESSPFMKGGQGTVWQQSGAWSWYTYTCFYTSLAVFQEGGRDWSRWYPAMAADLIRQQSGDGSWQDPYGGVFTALAVLSLELPYRFLPLFQEGGAGREGR